MNDETRPLLATPPAEVTSTTSVARRAGCSLLLIALMFVVGILFGLVMLRAGIELPHRLPVLGVLALAIPLSYFHIVAHELGHAIAGRLMGYQLLLFAIGPLQVRRTRTGFQLERSHTAWQLGGFVAMTPHGTHRLRQRHLALVAGGPLVSLLLTIASGWLFLRLDAQTTAAELLYLLTIVSLVTTVGTLLPRRSSGVGSDGYVMLELLRGGPQVEQRLAVALLTRALLGGVRPRDLDPALIDRALAIADPASEALAHYLTYWRDLDRGDVVGAAGHLDRALEQRGHVLPTVRAIFAAEAAYLTARHGHDPATARAWLALAQGKSVDQASLARAEAAVLLAEGQPELARPLIDSAIDHLARSIDIGGALAEADLLAAMRDEAAGGVHSLT